ATWRGWDLEKGVGKTGFSACARVMIHRTGAASKTRIGADRLPDVSLGARDRVRDGGPSGQLRGDGRRKRAPGSMRMRCVDARRRELVPLLPVEQNVVSGPHQVSAFYQDRSRAQLAKAAGGFA